MVVFTFNSDTFDLMSGMSGAMSGLSGFEEGMSDLESGMSQLSSAMERINQMRSLRPRSRDRVTPSSSNGSAQYMPPSNLEAGHPDPSDGIVHRRVGSENWSEYHDRPSWATKYRYGAETSFELDVESADLFLISRGLWHSGGINVVQSKNVGEKVGVNVKVGYQYKEALAIASVCLLERREGGNGVGIFTSIRGDGTYRDHKDTLKFKVTVTLPAGKDGRPLKIKKFTTKTSLFSYKVGDFLNSVLFEEISIQTLNGIIEVGHVTAKNGSFQSRNGSISGKFKTSNVLKLITLNGGINVDADLFCRENAGVPKLEVKSCNGPIHASVALESSTGRDGAFEVSIGTFNGSLSLVVRDSPASSHLVCTARTTTGTANVQMHPAFEGQFKVRTTNVRPALELHKRTRVAESVHRGRRRVVDELTQTRNLLTGNVYWSEDGTSRRRGGFVGVTTTNHQAKLTV